MQTQMKACQQPLSMVRARLRPNACPKALPFNAHPPHAAVQEMSDLLDADLGGPALEVLTRLCDQGVRPPSFPVRRRARDDRRALRRSIRRRSRPSSASCGRNADALPPRRRRRGGKGLGDDAPSRAIFYHRLRQGHRPAAALASL